MSSEDYNALSSEKKVFWLAFFEGEQVRQGKDADNQIKKIKSKRKR